MTKVVTGGVRVNFMRLYKNTILCLLLIEAISSSMDCPVDLTKASAVAQ